MATPGLVSIDQIRRKAERLFPQAVDAWLAKQDDFFPVRLRLSLKIPAGTPQGDVVAWSEELEAKSKSSTGTGYRVKRSPIRSRSFGTNDFPTAIYFESLNDLASFTGNSGQLKRLNLSMAAITSRLPQLGDWLIGNWKRVVDAHDDIQSLLTVVEFIRDNPRPHCYVRELPIAVSTKLVPKHKRLLQSWLDIILPPEQINFGVDDDFAARYGFRAPRLHILLRVLDGQLLDELGLPCSELSLSAVELASLPVRDARVIFTENKINVLTVPALPRAIVLGGLGNNLKQLDTIPWLKTTPIVYFGDIDVEGFQILARFRRLFPHTESMQMHPGVLTSYRHLCILGKGTQPDPPIGLTDRELDAFNLCAAENLRLEQERVPFPDLSATFNAIRQK